MSTLDRARRSPLHHAALEDDVAEVRRLVVAGVDVDARDSLGFTPLHFAAQEFSVRAAPELLASGASVDAQNRFGNSPLFVAVFNSRGRGELIELLRSHGADPSQRNTSGQNPVGLARLIANYDVAQYLSDLDD